MICAAAATTRFAVWMRSRSSNDGGWKGASREGKVALWAAYVDSMVFIPDEMMLDRVVRGEEPEGAICDKVTVSDRVQALSDRTGFICCL